MLLKGTVNAPAQDVIRMAMEEKKKNVLFIAPCERISCQHIALECFKSSSSLFAFEVLLMLKERDLEIFVDKNLIEGTENYAELH